MWAERKSAAGWFAQMEIMICPLQRVEREGGFKEHEVQKNGECAAGGKSADWLRGGGESDDFKKLSEEETMLNETLPVEERAKSFPRRGCFR